MSVSQKDKELERVLKALANRRRLAILRCIVKEKQVNVGRMAEELKLSFKSTSRHLAVLVAAGVLDKEQRSSQMFFSLSPTMHRLAGKTISHL